MCHTGVLLSKILNKKRVRSPWCYKGSLGLRPVLWYRCTLGKSNNQTVEDFEASLFWLRPHRGVPKMKATRADVLTQHRFLMAHTHRTVDIRGSQSVEERSREFCGAPTHILALSNGVA